MGAASRQTLRDSKYSLSRSARDLVLLLHFCTGAERPSEKRHLFTTGAGGIFFNLCTSSTGARPRAFGCAGGVIQYDTV